MGNGFSILFWNNLTYFFSQINETMSPEIQISWETKFSYSIKSLISTLRSDRNFMIYCVYTAIWTFSLSIAAPFFSVYMVQDLNATAAIVGVTVIVSRLASLPAQKIFGGLADNWGSRKLMMITGFIIPILPFL